MSVAKPAAKASLEEVKAMKAELAKAAKLAKGDFAKAKTEVSKGHAQINGLVASTVADLEKKGGLPFVKNQVAAISKNVEKAQHADIDKLEAHMKAIVADANKSLDAMEKAILANKKDMDAAAGEIMRAGGKAAHDLKPVAADIAKKEGDWAKKNLKPMALSAEPFEQVQDESSMMFYFSMMLLIVAMFAGYKAVKKITRKKFQSADDEDTFTRVHENLIADENQA